MCLFSIEDLDEKISVTLDDHLTGWITIMG